MRKLWGNVNGERMYYALHGYDIQAVPFPDKPKGMWWRTYFKLKQQDKQAFLRWGESFKAHYGNPNKP